MEDFKMNDLANMTWIELRKAVRSKLPFWIAIASLFMPVAIAFLIFVSKNPDISEKLGLVGAKANLVAYAATDWPAYLVFFNQMVAAAGFIFLVLAISWVFGREFAEGTVKDLLAVPVHRASILMAKFIVMAIWSAALTLVMISAGFLMGMLINLPGGAPDLISAGRDLVGTAILVVGVVFPFAFFASVGRGYLLPFGIAILMLMMGNLVVVLGWGEYFPWAVPMLFAQDKSSLTPISYWIVLLTSVTGMFATYLWWMNADQNR
jgi:ABC-2 type transport system permease protein